MDQALYKIFYEQEEAHWWFAARREILKEVIDTYGGLEVGDTILDVGCGTGALLKELSTKYKVVGTDASPHAVKFARMRGLDVYEGYLDALPREKFKVKTALLLDVIEHIDDDVGVLREVRDLVGSDGTVIVTVPAYQWMWSSHDVVNHHKRRYDTAMLRRSLDAAGLEPIKVSYFNTFLFPLAVARRLLDRDKAAEAAHEGVEMPPAPVNALFRRIFEFEKAIVPKFDLPFGVSLLAVCRPKRGTAIAAKA